MVTVRDVSHRFPEREPGSDRLVLDDVSFTIAPGEFVAVVGQSGCGKTTLLNMVAGFLRPTSGAVLIKGGSVKEPSRNASAYMFARDNLLPWRKALGNVELAMEMGGRPSRAARGRCRQRAKEWLDLVGLSGFEEHYPRELSQGMRQRVALARTLAVDAELWLMDEPFAALDASTRTIMQAEFTRIWESTRKTVILVTHDLIEAIALADRVITMTPSPGRITNVHTIDLPRPRRVLELHEKPEFLSLYRRLWHEIWGETSDAESVADGIGRT